MAAGHLLAAILFAVTANEPLANFFIGSMFWSPGITWP